MLDIIFHLFCCGVRISFLDDRERVELASGYSPAVYNTSKEAGGLCIADEVQAGFARTRSHFWGFEAHGIVPDIV